MAPRAMLWRAGTEVMFSTLLFLATSAGMRRFAKPFSIPNPPWRPKIIEEGVRGNAMLVFDERCGVWNRGITYECVGYLQS